MIWAWRGLRSAAVDDQNEWWSGKVCLHQRGFGFAVDESNKIDIIQLLILGSGARPSQMQSKNIYIQIRKKRFSLRFQYKDTSSFIKDSPTPHVSAQILDSTDYYAGYPQ
jgi:hypothetical protein